MSEFGGKGSGSERFDTFFREEVAPQQMTDEEYNRRREERRERREKEQERRNLIKKIGKRIVAGVLAVGIALPAGIFLGDSVEKGLRKDEFNEATKNHIWVDYGTTTYQDDLTNEQFASVEKDVLTDKTEKVYDLKEGEGSFASLDEEKQNALVGESYEYYGREENKPEDIANVSDEAKEWADEAIGEDTALDKIKDWFDNKN